MSILLLVVHEEHRSTVDALLASALGPAWEFRSYVKESQVCRVTVSRRQIEEGQLRSIIRTHSKSPQFLQHVVVVACGRADGLKAVDGCPVTMVNSAGELKELRLLERYSFCMERAWFFKKCGRNVEEPAIRAWLSQFDSLNYRWVGERLLASLRVVDSAFLCERLVGNNHSEAKWLVYSSGSVEGGDALAVALRDHVTLRKFSKLAELEADTYIWFEDTMISGTECLDRLALLSAEPWFGSVELRFGLVCDLGCERVSQAIELIRQSSVPNLRADFSRCEKVSVLTVEGRRAAREGRFYEPTSKAARSSKFIDPLVFQDARIWGGSENVKKARRILSAIGCQLYQSRNDRGKCSHSDAWIKQSGLGAGGLGWTILTPWSVPKSCPPVLWASGDVRWMGRSISWQPLFRVHDA